MRIGFVIPYFHPAWQYGGSPRSAYELARGIAKKGHHVKVMTTDTCGAVRIGRQWLNKPLDGIEVVHFRNLSNYLAFRQRISIVPGLSFRLRKYLEDIELVHIHEYRSLITIAAVSACKAKGIPYVLSPHGGLKPLGKKILKKAFDRFKGHSILEDAQRVLTVSPLEEVQALGFGVPINAISTIPNALPVRRAKTLSTEGRFRSRWSIHQETIILFLGRLNSIKGADLLVRALTNSKAHLVLAGPDDGQESELRRLVKRLGLDARVTFTGFLNDEQKLDAFVDANLTVIPSRNEIFSITMLESLLCARPVLISSACGFFPMPGYDEGAMQFKSEDVEDLSEQISKALNDKRFFLNAEEGSRFAAESFGIERVTSMTEKIYLEVIGSKSK